MRDTYGRVIDYMRISVTDRCNLRCIYCMPPEGVEPIHCSEILTFEEIARVARIAAGLGMRKVRITGGEPLVRKDLCYLIEAVSRINGIEDISLTTNGMLLKRYAHSLAIAGLTRVNVSLDTLNPERYRRITRGGRIEDVFDGIMEAEKEQLLPIKINMIPIRGLNDDELVEFARLTLHTPYHVRFIEWMPTGLVRLWNRDQYISADEMKERVSSIGDLDPVKVRKLGPARYFSFAGARGVIGFISPITHHFCDECNRLRLTADGRLLPCLFSTSEVDLKSALRSGAADDEIVRLLRLSVEIKPQRHFLAEDSPTVGLKPISAIGG